MEREQEAGTVRLYDKHGLVYEDILLSEYENRHQNGWASEIEKWELKLEGGVDNADIS